MRVTGRVGVDLEHFELLSTVDLLKDYLDNGYLDSVPLLVIIFNTKLVKHCITEEALLEILEAPNLEEHKQAHKELIALATGVLLKLETNSTFGSVAEDLESIITKHIEMYDEHAF